MTVHAETLHLNEACVILPLHQIANLLELRLGRILIGVCRHDRGRLEIHRAGKAETLEAVKAQEKNKEQPARSQSTRREI